MQKGEYYLREAERIFEEIGAKPDLERTRELLGKIKPEAREVSSAVKGLKERRELSSIFQVSQMISSILDIDELLNKIMDSVIEVMGAERGFLMLYKGEGEERGLEINVVRNITKETIEGEEFEISRGIVKEVEKKEESMVILDAQADTRFKIMESVLRYGLRSIICTPLKIKGKMIGLIYLDNKLVANLFTEEDLPLMDSLATQAAISIENAMAYETIKELNVGLEKKVQERTKELRESHEELKDAYKRLQTTQAQLIQSSKMASLGQLVAGIAHEINNPLSFSISNVDLLKNKVEALYKEEPLEDIRKLFSRSMDGLERVKKIVLDLRGFSRLDEAERKEADINEGIEHTLTIVGHLFKEQIKLNKELGDIPRIECYPRQLNQVVMNLLVNAVEAIEGEGEVGIKTYKQGENIVIEVSDSGMGIPEDIKDKIYDPFFSTKKGKEGMGLGLSICYGIVQTHKGRIEVESEVGKGSRFRVLIPLKS